MTTIINPVHLWIRNPKEVEALPPGTVVADGSGGTWLRAVRFASERIWRSARGAYGTDDLLALVGPVRVVNR